jgi:sugar O-acyltransferase (sialic acid O-acetyltransferase NeuD family)
MPESLVIVGTGGNALDILDVVDALNRITPTWTIAGFLDDSKAVGTLVSGYTVLGGLVSASQLPAATKVINAIGSDRSYRKRADIVQSLGLTDARFATLVHPLAAVSSRAVLGAGACVNAGAVVAAHVQVGRHVWLGSNCTIGHDSIIGDFAMVAPAAVLSGSVVVCESTYVGAGACVRPGSKIGLKALVGLGAVVIGEVTAAKTVVGNPARVLVRKPKPVADTPAPKQEQPQG